jgi:hypothetical protein
MSGRHFAFDTLFCRPRIERVEPVHSHRLPSGRALVEIEVSGWGLLGVGRGFHRPYWGRTVRRCAVPIATPFRVHLWGVAGRDQRECRVDSTLTRAPVLARGPQVIAGAIRAPEGYGFSLRLPSSFDAPRPRIRISKPRLGAPASIALMRPHLPAGPRPMPAVLAKVHMPPVLRERLSPPPVPADAHEYDTHRGHDHVR